MSVYDTIISKTLSREQIRQVDQRAIEEYAMCGLVLMENAGRGVAEAIAGLRPGEPVGILCGRGNNAGDGYVIARHLELAGRRVRIIQLFSPGVLRGDALVNWTTTQRAGLETRIVAEDALDALPELLSDCGVLVDCMLGTGATGDPRAPLAEAVEAANDCDALRVAVDVPTGLDCQSGEVGTPCFRAAMTCTFVANKVGFEQPAARPYLGEVRVIHIGVPRQLLREYVD